MIPPSLRLPAAAALLAAGMAGQDAPSLAPIELRAYDEGASRRCFAALDANADDRLSVFELAAAFEEAADARDPSLLRSLDQDRDGFVDWGEFDLRVRNALRLHGVFVCRPARALAEAPAATTTDKAPLDPAVRAILDLTDRDGSESLSPDEFKGLVLTVGLPVTLAEQFRVLDTDKDGALGPSELTVLTPVLPALMAPQRATSPARAFPGAWGAADRNADGHVDAQELERALRRHEVSLGRWATQVIRDADRTGDGRLGAAEVLAAPPRRAVGESGR